MNIKSKSIFFSKFFLVIATVRFELCIVANVLRKNEPHRKPLIVATVRRKYYHWQVFFSYIC